MDRKVLERIGIVSLAAALSCIAIPAAAIASGSDQAVAVESASGVADIGAEGIAEDNPMVTEGVFDENPEAQWRLGDDGVLYITGTGATCESGEIRALYENINGIVIGQGITTVGEGTFAFLNGATSVEFEPGSACVSIGSKAFFDCEELESVSLPTAVESLGSGAFQSCWSLRHVDFGGGGSRLTTIGGSAFNGCEQLREIELPSSLREIGAYAFTGCTALKSISIPAGVSSIGQGAFEDCSNLKTVTMASSSKASVASDAFTGTPVAKKTSKATRSAKRVKIKKLKVTGKRRLAVGWTKRQGAKRYVVFYKLATAKHYRHKSCSNPGKRKLTLKKLKRGKRYKVYVVAKAGSKVLSKSKVKKSSRIK